MGRDYSSFLIRIGRGHHGGTDPTGAYWSVHQGASTWEVYCDGEEVFNAGNLGEARLYIYGEVREKIDPEYKARQEARRAKRRRENSPSR